MPTGLRIYNLFPLLAGSIDRWIADLPRIASMGFDWVYVNPFHYPGFSGSLYSIKDLDRLHPVVQGDAPEAPDDLLRRFTKAAEKAGLRVMLDLVVNHTAKDALLAEWQPDWYRRDEDGGLYSPRAVNPDDPEDVTIWGDLAELDYHNADIRENQVAYWRDYVIRMSGLGFAGFRCDAAYQVPADVWSPLIAAARGVRRDSVFAAETLGCTLEQVADLAGAGFDYLFNSAKWWDFEAPWLFEQYDLFRPIAPSIAFPENHDTERLIVDLGDAADHAADWYRLRLAFCALFSTGLAITQGYEYGFAERLNVVDTRPDAWDRQRAAAPFDLSPFIAEVNRMKASQPALNKEGAQAMLQDAGQGPLVVARFDADTPEDATSALVYAINPSDSETPPGGLTHWLEDLPVAGPVVDVTPFTGTGSPLGPDTRIVLPPRGLRVLSVGLLA